MRMLTLSRAVPITFAMSDPHRNPCEASQVFYCGRLPKPGPTKLDSHEVLLKHQALL